jgi:phosphatidylglycerol:prolipoprotein diacylglycerol transferase
LTRVPAVLPGSWPALISLGVIVGVLVQATLLAEAHVGLEHALMIDGLALGAGLIGAKLWYVALKPQSWRKRMSEGWSVDGLLVAAPVAGIAAVGAHELAIAAFLDASTPALFLGIAIGRLGCFFTGCCAGRFTSGALGIWSSDRRIGARRIPTQLVESAAALLIAMAALAISVGGYAPEGAIFVGGLSAYLVARQRLLRIRADARGFSRAASLTAVIAGLVFIGDALVLVVSA